MPRTWDSHQFILDFITLQAITTLVDRLELSPSSILQASWATLLARHLDVGAVQVQTSGPDGPNSSALTVHEQGVPFSSSATAAYAATAGEGSITLPIAEFHFDPHETAGMGASQCTNSCARLSVTPSADGYRCGLEIHLGAVGPTTSELMAVELGVLLTAASENPHSLCSELTIMPESERNRLTEIWGVGPEPAPTTCFTSLFDRQVKCTPNHPAVRHRGEMLTYTDLRKRAEFFASMLRAAACGHDRVVGIMLERNVDFIAALLGALRSGATFVPLDLRLDASRRARMIAKAECTVILSSEEHRADLAVVLGMLEQGTVPRVIEIDSTRGSVIYDNDSGTHCCTKEAIAYILFTSGSTGEPKGVLVEHQGMVNHMLAKLDDLAIDENDVVGQTGPPSFDIIVWQCLAPLLRGATVVVIPDEVAVDPLRLPELVDDEGVTILQLVPAVLRGLVSAMFSSLTERRMAMASLRWIVPTGDALPEDLCRQWFELKPDVPMLNTYGSAECSDDQCHLPLYEWTANLPAIVSIGRPIQGIRTYVLDHALELVPVGVAGELYIGGVGVGRGYLGNPELTAAKFIPDIFSDDREARLYRSGDKVRWRTDGTLDFLGRIDHRTVKVRGHRIDVDEIERILRDSDDVYDCVVLTYAHGGDLTDTRLAAYVVPNLTQSVDRAALRNYASASLPKYMQPSGYILLNALPVNASGKVDRNALLALGEQRLLDIDRTSVPETIKEVELAQLWSTVLGISEVPVDHSFLDLGGHSLLAMRLVALIRQHFATAMTLRDLFEHPTVREMAHFIEDAERQHLDSNETGVIQRDPAGKNQPFALTPLQEAYWVGRADAIELSSVNAHVYIAIDIVGLDLPKAIAALQQLVARHDALRLLVTPDGEQRVLPDAKVAVDMEDLRGCPTEVVAERVQYISEQMVAIGPDSSKAPAMEVYIQILDRGVHRVHASLSLLVADGLSEHVLLEDWLTLYRGKEVTNSDAITYRDYVCSITDRRNAEQEVAWAYWQERLKTLPTAPELPVVDKLPKVSGAFTRRITRLDSTQWLSVKRHAAHFGVTPTVALLTLYAEVLAAWSKSPTFTINVLTSWRAPDVAQAERVVGNLSSTLPIEIDCSSELGFAERARFIQNRLFSDLEHGQIDGVRLARAAAQNQGWSSRAMFPVVFASVLDVDTTFLEDLPFDVTIVNSALQTPHVYLDHQVYEYGGALQSNWDTVETAFLPGVVDAAFRTYQDLLASLATEATWYASFSHACSASTVEVVEPTDASLTLDDTGLLHTAFFVQAERTPNALAVVDGDARLTYGELAARAEEIGGWLRERGTGPGLLVPIVAEKGWEQVAAVLGTLRSGAAYLPIDAGLPDHRIGHLLAQATADSILTQSWVANRMSLPSDRALFAVDLATGNTKLMSEPAHQCPSDTAYVIFTSGSTGEPKGVEIDHRGAVNTVADVSATVGLVPGDVVVGMSSLSFDLSVYDVFGPLSVGATLVLPDRDNLRDPAHWAALLARERVTLWNSVPALMEILVDHLESKDQTAGSMAPIRATLLSGDWIPVTLPDRIRRLWPTADVISLGGATEASIWSVIYPIKTVETHWRSIPYGTSMTNQQMHILDNRGRPRPTWVTGGIAIGGVGVARGYWQDSVRTAERFIRHEPSGLRLYLTGDLGRTLPDGTIEFLGREDQQVKINGYRVELGEIEAVLTRHGSVRDAVVMVRTASGGGKSIAAYVVPVDADLDSAELREHLSNQLPQYMVPAVVEILSKLPLTVNGKVDRTALANFIPTHIPIPSLRRTPMDNIERSLLELFNDLLSVAEVGVDDDFFAIGGNSFTGMRLAIAIARLFDVEVPLSSLFTSPTVAGLARLIRGSGSSSKERSPLVMINQAGSGAPLFWVHPVGGTTLCYANLARQLSPTRPFYGIDASGLQPGERPLGTIEQMATAYVDQLRTVQPHGPYLLGGWSMGGLIAFEMARQLEVQGERTSSLVVVDAVLPYPVVGATVLTEDALVARMITDLTGDAVGRSLSLDSAGAFDLLRERGILPVETSKETWLRLFEVYSAHLRAIDMYTPGPYCGKIRVIQASVNSGVSEDPGASWRQAGLNVEIDLVPGDHYTMWNAENLKTLTAAVRKCVDAAEGVDAV